MSASSAPPASKIWILALSRNTVTGDPHIAFTRAFSTKEKALEHCHAYLTHVISIANPAIKVDLLRQKEWQYERRDASDRLEVRVHIRQGHRALVTISEEQILA